MKGLEGYERMEKDEIWKERRVVDGKMPDYPGSIR